MQVKIKRGEEEMNACLKSYPDDISQRNSLGLLALAHTPLKTNMVLKTTGW